MDTLKLIIPRQISPHLPHEFQLHCYNFALAKTSIIQDEARFTMMRKFKFWAQSQLLSLCLLLTWAASIKMTTFIFSVSSSEPDTSDNSLLHSVL